MISNRSQAALLTVTLADNNAYLVTELTGEEGLSEQIRFTIKLASKHQLEDKNLGKSVMVTFVQDQQRRCFWGLCASIEFTGFDSFDSHYFYQIESVDPFTLLAFRQHRQIFQNISTKQILDSLFDACGFTEHIAYNISGEGKRHPYCVQLDETDQAFIYRLLANEGWHFHINHSPDKPSIVIGDSNQRFQSINENILYYQDGSSENHRTLTNWRHTCRVGVGMISISDHNQCAGEKLVSGETPSAIDCPLGEMNQYQFGLGHDDKDQAIDAAKRYIEALDVEKSTSSAISTIAALACGQTFKLCKHPVSALNQEYVITHITHRVLSGNFGAASGSNTKSNQLIEYENHFTCIPINTVFRPLPRQKPKVHSVHTASVTGPKGEEIYCDKYGRVKVQFHWDQQGEGDENTSCWLPVSQTLASKGFGAQFTPRIGDDVLVQYIEGDPDRPVIVGALYNDKNTAPYAENSQSGIKTHTTPDGSSIQGNELRFDDKKDNEQIFIHAEKDLLIDVNNDSAEMVKGQKKIECEKIISLAAKENITLQTEKNLELTCSENFEAKSAQKLDLVSNTDLTLTAKSAITIDGAKLAITGKSAITLTVGASKIEITPSGITISAPQITINANAKVEMKAAMINIEGQGKTDIKGALISINANAMTEIKAGAITKIQAAIVMVN